MKSPYQRVDCNQNQKMAIIHSPDPVKTHSHACCVCHPCHTLPIILNCSFARSVALVDYADMSMLIPGVVLCMCCVAPGGDCGHSHVEAVSEPILVANEHPQRDIVSARLAAAGSAASTPLIVRDLRDFWFKFFQKHQIWLICPLWYTV